MGFRILIFVLCYWLQVPFPAGGMENLKEEFEEKFVDEAKVLESVIPVGKLADR